MTSTEIQHDLDRLQSQLVGAKDARRKLQKLLETTQENVTTAENDLARLSVDRTMLVRRAIMAGNLEGIDDRETVEKSRHVADLLAHRRGLLTDIEKEISAVDKDMVNIRSELSHARALLGQAIFNESMSEIRHIIPALRKSLQGWCAFADRSSDDHLARGCWLSEVFNRENTPETPTAA